MELKKSNKNLSQSMTVIFFRQKINLLTSKHGNFFYHAPLSFERLFFPILFLGIFFFLGKEKKIMNDSDNDELWVGGSDVFCGQTRGHEPRAHSTYSEV